MMAKPSPRDQRSDARRLLDQYMDENTLQASVIALAERAGWLIHHETDSRRSKPGLPDLICAHPIHGTVFIELKTETGKLRPAQMRWRTTLIANGSRYYVFRPRDRDVLDHLLLTGTYPNPKDYAK